VLSLFLLATNAQNVRGRAVPGTLRIFKHENASTEVRLDSGNLSWLRPTTVTLRDVNGFDTKIVRVGARSFEIKVTPRYAGTFVVTAASLGAHDALGAFVSERDIPLELRVECLPLALLSPDEPFLLSPITVGENPVGRKGTGQELYAVEEYHANADSKDILWKRVARAGDDSIPVRVRETNLRTHVTIDLELHWSSEDERTRRMDLALEAIARIGRVLLSAGTELEIVYPTQGSAGRSRARTRRELAELLIEVSCAPASNAVLRDIQDCDLLVICADAAAKPGARYSTPTLIVSDEREIPDLPADAFVFTGSEDLSTLTMLVLDR
jgi:uncharacterized protein (DUF58 family)